MTTTNLSLRNKKKDLDKKSFTIRAQNGFDLFAMYEYKEAGKVFFLDYNISRIRDKNKDCYVLTIEEGEEKADISHFYCSKRDERLEFSSAEEVLAFLKEKEYFNIKDWGHRKGQYMKKD